MGHTLDLYLVICMMLRVLFEHNGKEVWFRDHIKLYDNIPARDVDTSFFSNQHDRIIQALAQKVPAPGFFPGHPVQSMDSRDSSLSLNSHVTGLTGSTFRLT
ncbi:MAG: hypothetical protein OXG56_10270 [Gammaproteobacteria bacterium]|nr:hypothetical protein [Gammaproteobacteria bacterium]